jgi:anti-sigma factor RsiW
MAGEALSPRSGRCDRARQWASLRVDGELSELEGALLDKHLEACPACRAFSEGLASATEIVRATPVEEPQIVYSPPERRVVLRLPVRRRVAVIGIAAAAALGSFVGSSLQRPTPTPEPASVPQVSLLTDMHQLLQLPRDKKRPAPAPARVPGQPPEGVV